MLLSMMGRLAAALAAVTLLVLIDVRTKSWAAGELRSRGAVRFNVASLYPLLYRLEKRNWIRGRWIEKAGQRRRRYYRLTPAGKKMLAKQRHGWAEFVAAVKLITQHA